MSKGWLGYRSKRLYNIKFKRSTTNIKYMIH